MYLLGRVKLEDFMLVKYPISSEIVRATATRPLTNNKTVRL